MVTEHGAITDHNYMGAKGFDVFSLTKIIAVEAKLNDISKVLQQAILNTRFASHSYALINTTCPRSKTIKSFERFGLGLYGKDSHFREIVKARERMLPSNYLSFQFNEWIVKIIAKGDIIPSTAPATPLI